MAEVTGRVHIYCRVSSAGQEDGSSLDTQEASCRAWAGERGLAVASVAREVWSGADRNRPGLSAAIERLLPGDVVLCHDLDRLSRGGQVDTAILIDRIETAGASVAFALLDFEQSEIGALVRNVRAFAAALEREKIGERTARGKRARVLSGKPLVGKKAPYGYRWLDPEKKKGGKTALVLDPEAEPVVRRIFDLALAGSSLRGIAMGLESDAIPSPEGKPRWSIGTIRGILLNPVYTGTPVAWREMHERKPGANGYRERPSTEAERVALPGIAPPIVTPEEQAAVQTRLDRNAAEAIRNNPHPEATLLRAGFVRCGECGCRMKVKNGGSGRPGSPPRYYCSTRGCVRPTISAPLLDGPVWEQVAAVLQDPAIIEREVGRHREDGGLDRDLAAVEKQIAAVAEKQTRTARAIAVVNDDDAAAPLLAELPKLAERKKALHGERDELARKIADRQSERVRVRSLTSWCEHVSANLATLSYAERRDALVALGVDVRVWKAEKLDGRRNAMPRWEGRMRPVISDALVFSSTGGTAADLRSTATCCSTSAPRRSPTSKCCQ
jgi:site-specific DNA recombinase